MAACGTINGERGTGPGAAVCRTVMHFCTDGDGESEFNLDVNRISVPAVQAARKLLH